MDRFKDILLKVGNVEMEVIKDKVEVIGLTIASCLNRAVAYWNTSLMSLDYEILEKGKQSFLGTKPYRIQVHHLPEEEDYSALEDFSVKLGVGDRLLDTDLDHYTAPQDKPGRGIVRNYFSGVFLTVFPPKGEGRPVEYNDIIRQIHQTGTEKFDNVRVQEIITEATGKPVRIADHIHQPENDSTCRLEISSNEMKAYAFISPPKRGGRHLQVRDVVVALKAHGVVRGFKEETIEEALMENIYSQGILAAEGLPAQNGANARIDYKVKMKRDVLKLQEDSLGRIDFKNLNIIENVIVGQILAEKVPAKKGKHGYTISNQIVEAKSGRDIDIKPGRGTILVDNGNKLTAQINGQVVLSRGYICVEPVYRVSGDVGPKTGNINFLGSVYVVGAVLSNFEVKASGNIDIQGGVQKANIEAVGDIVIRSGVQGGKIESTGGSVMSRFIQDAKVYALEDVIVSDGIVRSRIDTAASILCSGRRAQIVGGVLRAKKEIRSRVIGSRAHTTTEITVGMEPSVLAQYDELTVAAKDLEQKIIKSKKHLTTLEARQKAQKKDLTKEQKESLHELKTELSEFENNQSKVKEQLEEIKQHFGANSSDAKIHVEKQMHPGVVINIMKAKKNVVDNLKMATIYYENGLIKTNKLESLPKTNLARRYRHR